MKKEDRLKQGPISEEAKKYIKKKRLKAILNKYSIPNEKRKAIFDLLARGVLEREIENDYIKSKESLKKINVNKLKKQLLIFLENSSMFIRVEMEKALNSIISFEIARRHASKFYKKGTHKKTLDNLRKNPQNFYTYTILMKLLIDEIYPFFSKERKKSMPRKIYNLVAELLNATFPDCNFTPEKVRARYKKLEYSFL